MEIQPGDRLETTPGKALDYLTTLYYHYEQRKALVEDPVVKSNSRVLVLAPHHDDLIIG